MDGINVIDVNASAPDILQQTYQSNQNDDEDDADEGDDDADDGELPGQNLNEATGHFKEA